MLKCRVLDLGWGIKEDFCEKGTADQGPERDKRTWGILRGKYSGRWMIKLEDAKGEKMRSVGHETHAV